MPFFPLNKTARLSLFRKNRAGIDIKIRKLALKYNHIISGFNI